MKKFSKTAIAILPLLGMISLPSIVYAGSYANKTITNIAAEPNGNVYIKWANPPRFTCGGQENHGWVKIQPTANNVVKDLALSLYLNAKLARIDTNGCDGAYEIVRTLYSPGG